jgi:hypothetical protein
VSLTYTPELIYGEFAASPLFLFYVPKLRRMQARQAPARFGLRFPPKKYLIVVCPLWQGSGNMPAVQSRPKGGEYGKWLLLQ